MMRKQEITWYTLEEQMPEPTIECDGYVYRQFLAHDASGSLMFCEVECGDGVASYYVGGFKQKDISIIKEWCYV